MSNWILCIVLTLCLSKVTSAQSELFPYVLTCEHGIDSLKCLPDTIDRKELISISNNPYTKAKQIVSSYLQQDVGTDSSYFQLGIDSTLTSVQFYRTDSCLASLQKREDLYNWEIFSDGVQAPVNLWFTSFVKHEMNLISDKTEYRIRFSGIHKGFFSANVYLGEDENDYPMIMGRYELFLFYYNYELGVIQCYSHIDVILH